MVFWIALILTALGIAFMVATVKIGKKFRWGEDDNNKYIEFVYRHDDGLLFGGGTVAVISGLVVLIMLIAIIASSCGINAKVHMWRETYTALTYKLESGACRDEFGLLSKEIIDEVQDWNQNVAYNQNIQRDFWIGIFYPNVFDEFEMIDYERYSP